MLKVLNLKEVGSVEVSIALLNIEISNSKKESIIAIKLIHGYGSHGLGGSILKEVRKELNIHKKKGLIKDYFNGDKWNLFDKDVVSLLNKDKSIVGDCDLNKNNPGITIVIL